MPTEAERDRAESGLAAARAAYAGRDWATGLAEFVAAARAAPLAAGDVFALATCAWWLGDLDAALPALREAHDGFLRTGQAERAAVAALGVAYTFGLRGERAQASGWLSRTASLLSELDESSVHGTYAFALFELALEDDDVEEAIAHARRVRALGEQPRDPTCLGLGAVALGRIRVRTGDPEPGMALLDEAMLHAVSDALPPVWSGAIYCQLMQACHEVGDLRRAAEWTDVTMRWCETMPGSGPFLGSCRLHRANALQLRGRWADAEREAERVVAALRRSDLADVAEAHYLLAELRRRQGDLARAEVEYERAHALGRDPQPGMALLRLATGQRDAATASLRAALAAAGPSPTSRGRLLPAAVEVAVAVGDLDTARAAADELDALARTFDTDGFRAAATHARGMVLLADGDAPAALGALHRALRCWQELAATYEMARVRSDLSRAYEALGDTDAALRERGAAHAAQEALGARRATGQVRPAGLSRRELQILRHVAAGQSNRQIADDLVLSVRTVERHLATIYQKLGLRGRSARAGAVTFAHREGLVRA